MADIKKPGYPSNWNQMTPEEKRQFRLSNLLNTEGMSFIDDNAKKTYLKRMQRTVDVYNLKEPDRVPVNLPVGNLPLILAGLNGADMIRNPDKAVKAIEDFNNKYSDELEYQAGPPMTMPYKVMELMDYKLYAWPGHGIPEDAPTMQFVEGEYMTADEYDDLLRDPSDFWLRKYLPRVFGILKPLTMFQPFTNITENIHVTQFMPLASPEVQASLLKLVEVGKEFQNTAMNMARFSAGPNKGYGGGRMMVGGTFCKAPFDILGDTLRGTMGIMQDMFRRPEKLLKALDVIADIMIYTVLSADTPRTMAVSYPLHKGADGWMSQKQFDTFYWPSLKKVMDAYIQEGLIQFMFAEGSFNTRLKYIDQFPKGTVTWYFDRSDMALAKKILGKNCCLQGNIPASLLVTGSAKEVKEYCKNLIETAGKGGGFILSAGSDPDNPKLENIRAIMEAVREYGFYRK